MRRISILAGAGSIVFLGVTAQATSVVWNGNFATTPAVSDYQSGTAGQGTPPSGSFAWTSTHGNGVNDDAGFAAAGSATFPHAHAAPDNTQVGYLQDTGALLQTIIPTMSGNYTFSFDAESSNGNGNSPGQTTATLFNSNNQQVGGVGTGMLSTSWQTFSFTAPLTANKMYTLSIAQTLTNPTLFDVSLIDNVSGIAQAPEPGSAIIFLGAGACMVLRRRIR